MRFLAVTAALFLAFAVVCAAIPSVEEAQIYDKVVRLHVLANSDSEEDQSLKLRVRDSVLAEMEMLLDGCATRADAEAAVRANFDVLTAAAEEIVGDEYTVELTLTDEHYPARSYEEITLPAGVYRSLRVIIGKGEGRNWWCVLFPQLCTAAASKKQEAVEAGFTAGQIRILTEGEEPGYTVKFKLLEIISEFMSRE